MYKKIRLSVNTARLKRQPALRRTRASLIACDRTASCRLFGYLDGVLGNIRKRPYAAKLHGRSSQKVRQLLRPSIAYKSNAKE